ncbi:MAG TPA: helix-hairpin-helix domain-containing protein [Dokdonella sp.]
MKALYPLLLTILLALLPAATVRAQVDINHADARTLAESLDGIGLVKAEAIVAYRTVHGPFRRPEDLTRVRGIGSKTVEANRDAIVIVGAHADAAAPGSSAPY